MAVQYTLTLENVFDFSTLKKSATLTQSQVDQITADQQSGRIILSNFDKDGQIHNQYRIKIIELK